MAYTLDLTTGQYKDEKGISYSQAQVDEFKKIDEANAASEANAAIGAKEQETADAAKTKTNELFASQYNAAYGTKYKDYSDYVTSANLEYDRALKENREAKESAEARENERRTALFKGIGSKYDVLSAKTQRAGEQQISGVKGQMGITRGLGASSSRMYVIANLENENKKLLNDVESQRNQALLSLDTESADRLTARLNELNTQKWDLYNKKFAEQKSLLEAEEKKDETIINLQSKIPKGEKFSFGGKEFAGLKEGTADTKTIGTAETGYFEKDSATGEWKQVIAPVEGKTSMPTSYKEWELAGGAKGTGKTYAEFVGGTKSGVDTQTINQIDKISTSFDNAPIVKNFNDVLNKKLSVDSIIDGGVSGPRDLALVFDFMKALDPTSVVREAEYDTASKSGNIFAGVFAKFNGYLKEEGGFLPENVKQQFKEIITNKYDSIQTQYDNLREEKARLINKKTGQTDGADYLIDYKGEITSPKGQENSSGGVPDLFPE